MEFDEILENKSKDVYLSLIQKSSKIVLFRAFYYKDKTRPVFIELGKKANQILGISQRISLEDFLNHIQPHFLNSLNETIEDLRENNKPLDYETKFFNSNIKEYIWIHILCDYLSIPDENNGIKCVIGIFEDITDIKQKEISLNKKEEQLQNYKVVSVIASMLMHRDKNLADHISEILKTMGNSLQASCIAIFKDIENEDENVKEEEIKNKLQLQSYKLTDKWCSNPKEAKWEEFEQIFIDGLLYELECSSMKMYTQKKFDEFSSELIPKLESACIGSILRVPIFIGKKRYGTLIVNDHDKNREFKHNEIVLCLNIAFLIGMGLKINKENESKINLLDFFEDLEIGVFIIQQDEDGIYRFVYVNSQVCNLSGYTKDEIYSVKNFYEVISVENNTFIQSFKSKEFAVKNLPRSFQFKINVKKGVFPVNVSLANGEFNNHYAIYGIVYPSMSEKETAPIYIDLIEKINQNLH